MTRRTLALVALVAAPTISLSAYYARQPDPAAQLTTLPVTRGAIVTAVTATGSVQPVTTVQVGAQVSGIIESLPADFNSIVKKGQLLARLDQSTYLSTLQQARASLAGAQAEAERLRVASAAADMALARARELASRQLLPAADLQSAETDARTAAAQVTGADAKVKQARSGVQSAEVNLAKTVIVSPIDGVVTARNVDVGQTVSASFSAPTLFVLAADLSRMQLSASVDESDVGTVAPGQPVTFHVDGYPNDAFDGTVSQVRLNATTVNNVVTYAAIIDAPNPELKLKPGMTATATIQVARRDDALRVPSAVLRFKPEAAVLAQYGATAAPAVSGQVRTVWLMNGDTIAPVSVKTGVSDGTYTEVIAAPFAEGAQLVTRATATGASTSSAPSSAGNPLLPAGRRF